jgi:HEAT repeat protein
MKHIVAVYALLVAAVFVSGCSTPKPLNAPSVNAAFTLDELLGCLPAGDTLDGRWINMSLLQGGPESVLEICRRLGPAGSAMDAAAAYALSGLASFVCMPGAEADRLMFVGAIARVLEHPLPPERASFLISRLQVAGRAESVVPLSRFLNDEKLCEPATQALLAVRTGSEDPLLAALPGSTGSCRMTIMKALGELRSRKAVDPLLKEALNQDDAFRMTALAALANIGDRRAEPVLVKAAAPGTTKMRNETVYLLLLLARRLAESGQTGDALRITTSLYSTGSEPQERHLRTAALDLLVRIKGEKAVEDLVAALADTNAAYQSAVMALALKVPGNAATARWVQTLGVSPAVTRARILGMLGKRGDRSAFPAVLEALQSPDSSVRRAAIDAAVLLNPAEAVPALLPLLEQPGGVADEKAPKGLLFARTKDSSSSIRLSAVKALGVVAGVEDSQRLIDVLLEARTDGERSAAMKGLVTVLERIPDPEKRADDVIQRLPTATGESRLQLLRVLGRIGGTGALGIVSGEARSRDEDVRDAAIRALADWPGIGAYDTLLAVAKSREKLNRRVLALRGCVRMVENASLNARMAAHYHERTLGAAERIDEKRLVLGALGNLRNRQALRVVVPYIDDDSLGLDAAMAAWKMCSPAEERKDELGAGDVARTFIESRMRPHFKNQAVRAFDARGNLNDPPGGFTALFNGRDLSGWKGLVENPVVRASMDSTRFAVAQLRADSIMRAHWSVADGVLVFDGKGESICTLKDYGDFEFLVDWKIEKNGDSGIYLRGSPQVQIWDPAQWPEGSGGLYNNQKGRSKPLLRADDPIGDWNTFRIRMIHDRVTVHLNDVLVVDSVALENYWDRSLPIFPSGQIELQSHSSPLYFRNIYIREIPRHEPLFTGRLFNGSDLKGFKVIDGKEGNWQVTDGILTTIGEGGGWLSTAGQYGDFQLDLDFRLSEGGNSGVFIRSPRQGDPAYSGMEIQVLDDYAPVYANLKPWQYTGSIYGVQGPSLRAARKHDEWQHMQIVADGPRVIVRLNEQLIVDADLIAHMDQEVTHPGLKRLSGFIGFQSHTSRVEYRNITIRELR